MSDCLVFFDDGKRKLFTGTASSIIHQVYEFCENNNLTTTDAKWFLQRKDETQMKVIKETDGKHNGATIYCTVNGWDCPYYEDGVCYIKNPVEECDDFASFFETWEEWEEA